MRSFGQQLSVACFDELTEYHTSPVKPIPAVDFLRPDPKAPEKIIETKGNHTSFTDNPSKPAKVTASYSTYTKSSSDASAKDLKLAFTASPIFGTNLSLTSGRRLTGSTKNGPADVKEFRVLVQHAVDDKVDSYSEVIIREWDPLSHALLR